MPDVESRQREVQRMHSFSIQQVYAMFTEADCVLILEHPNLHLSPEERRLFGQLFSAADSEKIGVVTGEVAVKFFEKTRLSPVVLGEVALFWTVEVRGLR